MATRKNGFLSKIFTILLVPTVMAGAVYLIFQAFQSAYTSEAQIQVNEALWLDPYKDSTRLINEFTLNKRVQEMVGQITSDPPLILLGYRLGLHDLGENPFLRHRFLEEYDEESLDEIKHTFQQKLENLDPNLLDTDESRRLHSVMRAMKYLPNQLRTSLNATQIPGTSLIQVQANGRSPEMSGFMVNAFCEEFIQLVSKSERDRLEDMLRVLVKRYEKKKKDLKGNMAKMDVKPDTDGEVIDEELWELKMRIKRLENTRSQEEKRYLDLEKFYQEAEEKNSIKVQNPTANKGTKDLEGLRIQFEESRKRLEAIDKQLDKLRGKVKSREENILQPIQVSVDSTKYSLAALEKDKEKIEQAINYTDKLLIQVIKGKTRHPSPYTSLFLALQAGLATLLLWLIFLHQMNFIHLFKPPAKRAVDAGLDLEGDF
ncbi:MAG: hypothetical protein MRZ79_26040 [Bacteroidia bacterium]|nr:hypothetical protein [Bacteroidia bacterium]